MVPLGMIAACCLEFGWLYPAIRTVLDVLILSAAGIAMLFTVILCSESGVRIYHLLGLTAGALIWVNGIGKIVRWMLNRQDLKS